MGLPGKYQTLFLKAIFSAEISEMTSLIRSISVLSLRVSVSELRLRPLGPLLILKLALALQKTDLANDRNFSR
jgi:hypothetical protein